VRAQQQYAAAFQTSRLLRHATYWLLTTRPGGLQVDSAVAEFRDGVQQLESATPEVLSGAELTRFQDSHKANLEAGLPAPLAERIASLEALNAALDIVEIAARHRVGVTEAARVYFEVGTRVGCDWLQARIEKLLVEGPWQAVARTGLRDAALRVHRRLAERVLDHGGRGGAPARVTAWIESGGKELAHWQRTVAEMRAAEAGDFATLTVGVEALRKLAN